MFSVLTRQRILPAIMFSSTSDALPVAEALVNGGLPVAEITLRTDAAFECIRAIADQFKEITIGAGTILSIGQLHKAIDAGAAFGLSPSLNIAVITEAKRLGFPFIPGVMTPSEIETAYEQGYSILKLFPAANIGGVSFLKAMQGPYGHLPIQFIPMGGVNLQNMQEYLRLSQVIAVGGSWLAAPELIAKKQYKVIEENAREAVKNCVF